MNLQPSAYLIGAAGSGMSALAQVLSDWGWKVGGSEGNPQAAGKLNDRPGLRHLGPWYAGHRTDQLPHDADWVVFSAAVGHDNPERVKADELGMRCESYPQALGRLTQGKSTVAVAGTHGKSTVTAMAAGILRRTSLDAVHVIGAEPQPDDLGPFPAGHGGQGSWAVVEACEYQAHFLNLSPTVGVVLNIELDHFDYFRDEEHLIDDFCRFARRIAPGGLLLADLHSPGVRRMLDRLEPLQQLDFRIETLGGETDGRPPADWQAVDVREVHNPGPGCHAMTVCYRQQPLVHVRLPVIGRHQVGNALAAAAAAFSAGADVQAVQLGLERFAGLKRRLEWVGDAAGVTFVDDFAHHPTEIDAALAAVRKRWPGRPVTCVFQPHQRGRTARLLDEFAASLHNAGADRTAILDIYAARETQDQWPNVSAVDLARRLRNRGSCVLDEHQPQALFELLAELLAPGDVLTTLGAGDVGIWCHALCKRLQGDRAGK